VFGLGAELAQLRLLGNRQWRAGQRGVKRGAIHRDGPPAFPILFERRCKDRPAFKDKPLGSSDHTIDDGPLEQLPTSSDHEPSEAGEPGAFVQCLQKPWDVFAILDRDVNMKAPRSGQ
jgi:hypothetical protein